MFVLVQFPFVDLRPMVKGQLGRLPVPDWTADDPGETFVRGFGKMATRLSQGFGLLGERAFADFNNTARFPKLLVYRQEGWRTGMPINLWFRRLYFDGKLAGRFEYGFMVDEDTEDHVIYNTNGFAYSIGQLTAAVLDIPIIVRSMDGAENHVKLARCAELLGRAYLMATTKKRELADFPPAETYGRHVALGSPLIHVRVSNGRSVKPSRDRRQLDCGGSSLFITSPTPATVRNNVVVQMSDNGVFLETAQERAIRVIISHMNALMFAESHFLRVNGDLGLGSHSSLSAAVAEMLDRFQRLAPTGPEAENDKEFAAAIKFFADVYKGRSDELSARLADLAAELAKPSTAGTIGASIKSALQWLTELVITTGVKTSVQIAMKGP